MKLKILNRARRGLEIYQELAHDKPGYRRWIMVGPPMEDTFLSKFGDNLEHKFAITIFEKLQPEHENQFDENKGFKIERRLTVPDEDSLLKALLEFVPNTDEFDVPWKAYTWKSGQRQ